MRAGWTWIAAAVGLVVLILTGLIAANSSVQEDRSDRQPLSAHSSAPNGALALFLWTKELDRPTRYLEYEPFRLDQQDSLLVSLYPADPYTDDQVREVREWVERGGSLLLGTHTSSRLTSSLGIHFDRTDKYEASVPAQPLLNQPPVSKVSATSSTILTFKQGVPLLKPSTNTQDTPGASLVSMRIGNGKVWVLSVPDAFSNELLNESDNWKLYLNVLAEAREGTVTFDEYHHGRPEVVSLSTLVLTRPWGWAILYSAAIVLLYLLFSGRRMGRALRESHVHYRNAGEYIAGMAALIQRTRKPEFLSDNYALTLRRTLQQASGLPPDSSLKDMARRAQEASGQPTDTLLAGIERLERSPKSTKTILGVVKQTETIRRRLSRSRTWYRGR